MRLHIPEGKLGLVIKMKVSAVIFDLDGTVIADEDEYGRAFNKVLSELGVDSGSEYPHIGGIGVEENWRVFLDKYDIKTDKTIEELSLQTQIEYIKLIPEITLKDGFEKFALELKSSGIKTALATSNSWDVTEKVFDTLGIQNLFDSITTGEEVTIKKPSPQIFEIAADKLGVPVEECLVIEDSAAGVEAANSAGMKVVGIARDELQKKSLSESNLIVNSFNDITPSAILKID